MFYLLRKHLKKPSHSEIRKKYGIVNSLETEHYRTKSLTHGKGYGRVTDDTLMTLKMIEIYNEKMRHIDSYDVYSLVKKIFFDLTWVPEYQKEMPLIERLFYPEKYIFLSNYLANRDPRSGGVGNMVNCGAAMYIAPIGMVNACDPERAYSEAISFAQSHQTSYGLEAAGVFAAAVSAAFTENITAEEIYDIAVFYAKDGTKKALEELKDAVKSFNKEEDNTEKIYNIISKYSSVGENLIRDPEKVGIPTEAYTPSRLKSIEELPVALSYILLYDGDFDKSLINGVNWGRDTDSIGVMIGAVLGAKNGIEAISPEYTEKLCKANKYDFPEIADNFYKTIIQINKNDFEKTRKTENLKKAFFRGEFNE